MSYQITDFFLAVFLSAMGETLEEVRLGEGEVFVFAPSDTISAHVEAYRNDTAQVNPKVFARHIMQLRQQIAQAKERSADAPHVIR